MLLYWKFPKITAAWLKIIISRKFLWKIDRLVRADWVTSSFSTFFSFNTFFCLLGLFSFFTLSYPNIFDLQLDNMAARFHFHAPKKVLMHPLNATLLFNGPGRKETEKPAENEIKWKWWFLQIEVTSKNSRKSKLCQK